MSNRKFWLTVVLNYLPLLFWCIFYSKGANISIAMIPLLGAIALVNYYNSHKIKNILFFNSNLTLSTFLGIYFNSQLYFKFINYDTLGEAIRDLQLIVGFIYILILTFIMISVHRVRRQKST